MKLCNKIVFPKFQGLRCLMMPYIQGEPLSVPDEFGSYEEILRSLYFQKGEIGFLTIDESVAFKGLPHRGARARTNRALHTEAGLHPDRVYAWGGNWGSGRAVTLEPTVQVLLANNLDNTCAVWDAEHWDTSIDGDIGHLSHLYPYSDAVLMGAGEVYQIGIFTPHESLPVPCSTRRQFLRIVSAGVHGRESYFTRNPLLKM